MTRSTALYIVKLCSNLYKNFLSWQKLDKLNLRLSRLQTKTTPASNRRGNDDNSNNRKRELEQECVKTPELVSNARFVRLARGKYRPHHSRILAKLTEEELQLLENVKTSCRDLDSIRAAIQLRLKAHIGTRIPEDHDDSTYYMENGLRRVYPYYYLYQAFAKRRWTGKKLKTVLKTDFRDISDEQLDQRFADQRVLVNGNVVDTEYVLKNNDFITNRNHRHELPVLAAPIKILHKDRETIVINKPPSIPIHPCGRYRHNSILQIMRKEYDLSELKVVHRLDRLVSGILIFALNSSRANFLRNSIENRTVQKEYVCRVSGEFPSGRAEDDGEITVDQPLETVPGKIGVSVVLPAGKPSITKFKRLNYNGKTSAVLCKPMSGRMHQIRVHLQYLGHPIVNDSLYNCDSFGPDRGKNANYGKGIEQLSADILSKHRASTWLMYDSNDSDDDFKLVGSQADKYPPGDGSNTVPFLSEEERKETMAAISYFLTDESWKDSEPKWKFDQRKLINEPTCHDCRAEHRDPPKRSLFIYLHALKYFDTTWSYESELPIWAQDSWPY